MSEMFVELAETDALLTAISRGNRHHVGDPVLDALSSWVDEITSHPVRRVEMELPEFYQREATGRGWRIAATAVIVTAMSSSGIAAAATGDPLAPFSYVATALGHLAPSDRADQIRYGGLPAVNPDGGSRDSGTSSGDVILEPYGTYASAHTQGRHRAHDGDSSQPRHRATTAAEVATSDQEPVVSYTPRHVAVDSGPIASDPPAVTPPESTPVETPPVATPPVETPPDPAPADPDPVPGGTGGGGASPSSDAPPADSGSSGGPEAVGSAGGSGAAGDQADVRAGADTGPAETPADSADV